MSEWHSIERLLPDGVEDLFEEVLLLWNDHMNAGEDGAWVRFVNECKARYEAGRRQHADTDSTWDGWSDDDFAKNIREELIDYVIYAAARNAGKVR